MKIYKSSFSPRFEPSGKFDQIVMSIQKKKHQPSRTERIVLLAEVSYYIDANSKFVS